MGVSAPVSYGGQRSLGERWQIEIDKDLSGVSNAQLRRAEQELMTALSGEELGQGDVERRHWSRK